MLFKGKVEWILKNLSVSVLILPACPKCEQRLGCGKENCIDWFGFERLDALFRTKCKKCEFDLTKC